MKTKNLSLEQIGEIETTQKTQERDWFEDFTGLDEEDFDWGDDWQGFDDLDIEEDLYDLFGFDQLLEYPDYEEL